MVYYGITGKLLSIIKVELALNLTFSDESSALLLVSNDAFTLIGLKVFVFHLYCQNIVFVILLDQKTIQHVHMGLVVGGRKQIQRFSIV